MAHEYLKHEKIQIYLRLFFITIVSISIYIYYQSGQSNYSLLELLVLPIFVFIFNIFYFFILKYFPYKLQEERILFVTVIDIFLTVYVMSLVDDLGAYYAGALLWFIVGYGMRYGKKVAYTAYIVTLISWLALITTSQFWIANQAFALGWLVTFAIVPLYYFSLVEKLHMNIEKLHSYVEKSEHKALHDELTGLPNRSLFDEDLDRYMSTSLRNGQKFALFFIDLDAFKKINDTYGHDIGDRVLIEASKRLQNSVKATYRLGGDEFVCIAYYNDEEELINLAKNLILNLTMPCQKRDIVLSASIGISRFPDDAQTKFDLKKRADLAMYRAKESGKNRFNFYQA